MAKTSLSAAEQKAANALRHPTMSNSRKQGSTPKISKKKSQVLTKRSEFLRLQRRGLRLSSPFLTAYFLRAPRGTPGKIGYSVSKKVGNAPTRNLIKRRLRHLARENKGLWAHLLVSIIAKPKAAECAFPELEKSFFRLFESFRKKNRGPR